MPRKPKQPRIKPLEPPYDSATRAALEQLGPPLQLFRVFARRPEMARALAGWGRYYLSPRSALSLRHRELVIDRTTALCGANYEWGVHIAVFGAKAGLTPEQVASLAGSGSGDDCWPEPADRAVVAAVEELHVSNDLSDASWHALTAAIGEDAALELTLLAGWYHAISYAVRVLRLPLEPDTTGLPT